MRATEATATTTAPPRTLVACARCVAHTQYCHPRRVAPIGLCSRRYLAYKSQVRGPNYCIVGTCSLPRTLLAWLVLTCRCPLRTSFKCHQNRHVRAQPCTRMPTVTQVFGEENCSQVALPAPSFAQERCREAITCRYGLYSPRMGQQHGCLVPCEMAWLQQHRTAYLHNCTRRAGGLRTDGRSSVTSCHVGMYAAVKRSPCTPPCTLLLCARSTC